MPLLEAFLESVKSESRLWSGLNLEKATLRETHLLNVSPINAVSEPGQEGPEDGSRR